MRLPFLLGLREKEERQPRCLRVAFPCCFFLSLSKVPSQRPETFCRGELYFEKEALGGSSVKIVSERNSRHTLAHFDFLLTLPPLFCIADGRHSLVLISSCCHSALSAHSARFCTKTALWPLLIHLLIPAISLARASFSSSVGSV